MARLDQQNAPVANVGPPVADLCRRANDLCRRVAPDDLAGLPLYVLAQSAIRDTLGEARQTYGYTLSRLDLILRDQIGPAWQGRGPCIVCNDIAMREDLGPFLTPTFLANSLHELAHVLERGMTFEDQPEVCSDRLMFDGLVVAHAMNEPVPATHARQRFLQHDDRFLRAILHLRHRAGRLGVHLAPGMIVPDTQPMLWSPSRYRIALGDEPDRLRDVPIRTILLMDPPADFVRLWADELAFHSFPETTP
jgi:hypothetical protein